MYDPMKPRAHHSKMRALHRKHREASRNERVPALTHKAERRLERNDRPKLLIRAMTLE